MFDDPLSKVSIRLFLGENDGILLFMGHAVSYLYTASIYDERCKKSCDINRCVRNKYVLSLSLASEHLLLKISI